MASRNGGARLHAGSIQHTEHFQNRTAALQVGLGEASCLALCALYEPRRALTCWSSGTGDPAKRALDRWRPWLSGWQLHCPALCGCEPPENVERACATA